MIFIKRVLQIYSYITNGNPFRRKNMYLQLIVFIMILSANNLWAVTDIAVIDDSETIESLDGHSLVIQPDQELTNNVQPDNGFGNETRLVGGITSSNKKVDSPENNNSKTFVVGENLKIGMALSEAFEILGTPKFINVIRGSNPSFDSISIEYLSKGIILHALTNNPRLEALEVLPNFTGEFIEGINIGSKIEDLIKAFGIPKSMESFIARYPQKGIYFSLDNEIIISAQLFKKNSKLLNSRLYNNR
jgi:hypothetical protein